MARRKKQNVVESTQPIVPIISLPDPVTPLAAFVMEMQRQVQYDVNQALQAFRAKTGLTPSEIKLVMADATLMGDPGPSRMVVHVGLEFRL